MPFLRRLFPTRFAREFLATETAGGVVMIAVAALAIALANSPASETYHALTHATLLPGMSVAHAINDVLMAIFFFAVGMELKIEMREGTLAGRGQKLLPLIAALGGIAVPALLYLAITQGQAEYRQGWAIPTATDIAFALCVLRLAGPALPNAAKIFLLAIAIYDDLAAILIIALFYTQGISALPLAAGVAMLAAMALLNRYHLSRRLPYLLLGAGLWYSLYHGGIHPTVAGVVTGIAIPMRTHGGSPLLAPLLHRLHPYVAFAILPLFAFANAGVDLRGLTLADAMAPLPVAIALALLLGKPLGIYAATFACVRSGLSPLPAGVTWRMVYGVGIMAGIGFTMSLFIGALAFPGSAAMDSVKLGILAGSLFSSVYGLFYLRLRRMA